MMNKPDNSTSDQEKRAEYDFSKGMRGKYAECYAEGSNIAVVAPDLVKQISTWLRLCWSAWAPFVGSFALHRRQRLVAC